MNELRHKLGIDEKANEFTKHTREKKFNTVKDNIPLIKGYNYMADVLFLPTTKRGFKYLLVVVDLASDLFDIEPMKDKESKTVLQAMLKMFKRPYLQGNSPDKKQNYKPYASVRTDEGTEFMGVFHKWLYNNNVLHKRGLAGRHTQLANVERLNNTLGILFNGYMNTKELQTKKIYTEWTDILNAVRVELNKLREKKLPDNIYSYEYPFWESNGIQPKYKVGDLVHVKLNEPIDALGHKQGTRKFRAGDIRWSFEPKKIKQVFYYTGKIPFRYSVNGYPQVSFTEQQLKPASESEETYVIKKIIGEKMVKKKKYYLVWWKGYLKKDATWEVAENIV